MAELTDAQRSFIADNPYVATATTLRKDGSPHNTIVWIDAEDGTVTFNTAVGRAKERHLREDPRVAVTVVDPQNTYRWVSVSGRAELSWEETIRLDLRYVENWSLWLDLVILLRTVTAVLRRSGAY